MITIKEYADKHGKSKSAVYQQLNSKSNKEKLKGHIQIRTVNGKKTKFLDEIAEINGRVTCGLEIHRAEKVKNGKFVLGYEFEYDFHDELDIIADPWHRDSEKSSIISEHKLIEEIKPK